MNDCVSKMVSLLLFVFYFNIFNSNTVLSRDIQKDYSLETSREKLPSHTRHVKLLASNMLYLTIDKSGEVGSTKDNDNPDASLQMDSYSIRHKRIKRKDIQRPFYLAIDKNGRIRTRRKPKEDTLFIESLTDDGFRFWYRNNATGYYLAVAEERANTFKVTNTKSSKVSTEFQQIL